MKTRLKRLLAALLTLSVLATALSVGFAASAEETDAPTVAGSLILNEYVATGVEAYWSFTAPTAGCYLFSSNESSDTYGDLFDSEMNLLLGDDDSGNDYNFLISYTMEAGETVYLRPRHLDGTLSPCKVMVKPSDVKSIELYEMGDFQYIAGDFSNGSAVDDWFRYEPGEVLKHLKLQVTYNDNSTRIISGETNKNIGYIDNQEETHWVVGSDNQLTLTYQGKSTTINVTVVESPLKEIQLVSTNNFAYIENDVTRSSMEESWSYLQEEYITYCFYSDIYAVINSTFKLVYKDETEEIIEGYELFSDAITSSNQSCDTPWKVGVNADAVTLYYLAREVKIPVTVVENNEAATTVSSVSAELLGRPVVKNDDRVGYTVDGEKRWFRYEIGTILKDAILTVDYSAGYSERMPLNNTLFSNVLYDSNLTYTDPQTATSPWGVGDNSLPMSYKGVNFNLNVKIIETDVKSIKVIDDGGFTYIEKDVYTALPQYSIDPLGYCNSIWYQYRSNEVCQNHLTLEVTYLDGTVEQVKYFNPDNTWSGVICSDTQTKDTPWTVGGENIITIKYRNVTTTYNAKLVENPLAGTDYDVAFLPDGTIALSHYHGSETDITLPKALGGYTVTSLERGLLDYTRVQNVTIPAGINTLTINLMGQPFSYAADLKNIYVADDNTAFSSVDGVLMSKDKTKILAYPIGKSKVSYTIPAGVTEIEEQALSSVKFTSLFIPASVTKLCFYAFGPTGYITQVFYGGTQEQWNSIYNGEANECIYNAGIHYNTTAPGQHKYTKLIKTVNPTTSAEGCRRYQCESCTAYIDTSIAKLINLSTATISQLQDKTYTGKALTQSITVKVGTKTLKNGTDYTVSYSNNIKVGTAKLTIKAKSSIYGGSKTVSFNIKPQSLKSAKVSGIESKVYTGKKRTQSLKVTLGTKTLKNGTDYIVTYKNNTKAGKATIYVKGIGNYSGTITKTFVINPKSLKSAKVSGIENKAYTGKKRTQSLKVKLGTKTLKKGTDYKVTYKNNTKTGKATLYVKGIGNYSGTITKTFIIYPKKQKISSAKSPSKKKLTIKWTKDSNASGYQIVYATNSNFTKGKKTETVKSYKTYKKTIKSLKSKKTYYVKVRAYKTVSGKKYYGAFSSYKKVKVK